MPKESIANHLRDWEALVKAVHESEAELAGIEPFRAALERAVVKAVSAQVRRETLHAKTGEATRKRNEAFSACRDAASSLRSYVKSLLGFRSEQLVRYGIQPIRKRTRQVRKVPASCGFSN